jgi:hypothetical protein
LRSLIIDNVNNGLNDIVKTLFLGNRICDRAMSILSVKFAMNNTVNLIHPKLAHIYPKLADVVSDYQGDRNCLTVYGDTPLDNMDYVSPQDFFERILDYMIDLESQCYEVLNKAQDESDITTVIFLQNFINTLIPVTSQCLLFVDKCEAYKGDWMSFDHNIEDFITLSDFAGKG